MMDGFWVLSLQMLGLLAVAAAVFFFLAWSWRSRDLAVVRSGLKEQRDREVAEIETLTRQRDEAVAAMEATPLAGPGRDTETQREAERQALLEGELQEAQARQRNLERELLRLRDEKNAAEAELTQWRERTAGMARPLVSGAARGMNRLFEDSEHRATPPAPADEVEVKTSMDSGESPEAAPPVVPEEVAADLREGRARWLRLQQRVTALEDQLKIQRPDLRGPVEEELAAARRAADVLGRMLIVAAGNDRRDDLTQIKGIGSVLAQKLNEWGICSWRQLAQWSDEDVAVVQEILKLGHRVERGGWVRQANDLLKRGDSPAP
ncbi:MAG: hypothetical protein KDK99_16635 [Verrucomicrobiales bacterium]|nr:hypothetical protein [Verrucomicrobiales bacterium]